ncbi:MAG: PIN domain protein [Flavobacteriales bacterium]
MDFKKITLYVDTSVIGGYFDVEFAKETQELFDNLENSRYDIMYSSVTEDELLNAPKLVQDLLKTVPDNLKKRVELTEEAVKLADTYIAENVVGKTSREDCFHIALATINKADVLVSWNFKHVVNILRIRGYNAVNLKLGYSPKDIVNYE